MDTPLYFITGTGTDVGKTLASAILAESMQADYWKPVQAGYENGTDAETVRSLISNLFTKIHKESYCLQTPASPHIAARNENLLIDIKKIVLDAKQIRTDIGNKPLLVEGAGGLLVPISDNLFVADLAKELGAKIILVSRNYLGSINHSLLTAAYCKQKNLPVAGWIFTDDYLQYEEEIVKWTGYPLLGSIPKLSAVNKITVKQEAEKLQKSLQQKGLL